MANENSEPGQGNPDNSTMPETPPAYASSQSVWGNLSEDDKATIGNKGFKTPADLLKSYTELEKSSSNKFSIPKDDDEQAWGKLYTKLGKPEDISGYTLEVADADKAYADGFKSACLQAGLNNKQIAGIYNWYQDNQSKMTEKFNQQAESDKEAVKELWGNDYDKNTEIMKQGFRAMNLEQSVLENIEIAMGTKAFMLLGKHFGDMISPDMAKGLNNQGTTPPAEMSTSEYFKELFSKGK